MPGNTKQAPVKLAEPLPLDEIHVWSLAYRAGEGRRPLLEILGGYLACAAETVPLVSGAHGRPELAGTPGPALRFNWSHSGSRALVAVARTVQPGIDIEHRGRRAHTRTSAIARRFFSAAESTFLNALPAAERELAFLRLWTAKEALLKAQGQGLSFGLHRVDVELGGVEPMLRVFEGEDLAYWNLMSLDTDEAYVASLAWRGGPMAIRRVDVGC